LGQNNASHIVHSVDVDLDDVGGALLVNFMEKGGMII
jgi:hypothetical protein